MLAEADEHDVVKRLQEVFLEWQGMTPELMTTGLPTTINLTKPRSSWREQEEILFERMSNSLSGFCLNLRQRPTIRYLAGSQAAERLAGNVQTMVTREWGSNKQQFDSANTTLIITERSEDPATPLVFDWSYLSMIHECLGLDENKVTANKKVTIFTLKIQFSNFMFRTTICSLKKMISSKSTVTVTTEK